MKNFSSLLLTTSVVVFLSTPVLAQTAALSEQGAADLKKAVEGAMAYQIEMGKATGQGLVMNGNVEVSQKDAYYEVRIPGLAATFPDGGKLDIGTIVVNAVPGEEGSYATSVALPSPMTFFDKTNAPVAELSIGKQNFAGIWHPALDMYTKMQASYGDVAIKASGQSPFGMTIGDVAVSMALAKNADGTWSGPNNASMKDLKLSVIDKGTVDVSIASLTSNAHYDKIKLEGNKEIKDKALAMLKSNQSQPPSAEEAKKFVDEMMKNMKGGFIDGMKNEFVLSGLDFSVNPPQAQDGTAAKPVKFRLGQFKTAFNVAGLMQEKGSSGISFGMTDLAVQDLSQDIAGMVPTAANVEIALDNLPMAALGAAFSGILQQTVDSAMAAEDAANSAQKAALDSQIQAQAMATIATLPKTLADAGASLTVKNTFTKAPDINSTLDGQFTASATSPLMTTGSLTLAIAGMDELIAKMQAMAAEPGANPQIAGYVQGLVMLQMMGQQEQAPDGKSLRKYKLEVTPDGKALMNGADIGGMAGMMQGGSAAPGGMSPAPQGLPAP